MCVHVHLCARVSKHVCVRVHVKCLSVSLCAHMHHVYTCVLCMCVCIECVCVRVPRVCVCAHMCTHVHVECGGMSVCFLIGAAVKALTISTAQTWQTINTHLLPLDGEAP